MSVKGFRPEEVLFSPTAECNLSCAHCDLPPTRRTLSVKDAERFLLECKSLGVKRVGFTGGEPFLALDFLCALTRRAVKEGFLFDRIMTNAVWWRGEDDLKSALIKLYNAGYDGSICVSVDAFHRQSIRKVARFIELAAGIWRRPDVVSIAYVHGARDSRTGAKLSALRALVRRDDGGIFLKAYKIEMAPVGRASKLKDPWDGRSLKEDYCRGPGNAFFVMPNGDVKPCCGYAADRRELSIGNIRRDSGKDIMRNLKKNRFVRAVFSRGLSRIRARLENAGVRFPGKTSSHCCLCDYILTKVPRRVLARSLAAMLMALLLISQQVLAQDMKLPARPSAPAIARSRQHRLCGVDGKSRPVHPRPENAGPLGGGIRAGKDLREIPSSVVRKVKIERWYHEGLFYDGKSLWLANGEKGNIWIIDTDTGRVMSRMEPVADFPEALIRTAGGNLFTTEWYTKKIYRVKLEDARLVPEKESSLEPAHPAGLAGAGKRLFVVTWTRGLGTKFHMVEMDEDLKVVDRMLIRGIQEPCQLAWDGEYLWVSSWHARTIYKVDIDKKEIVGYFKSPVSKATGIAWDGKYMWITGTYGDLYQVEIGE